MAWTTTDDIVDGIQVYLTVDQDEYIVVALVRVDLCFVEVAQSWQNTS